MKKLIVHMGAHRCASSATQAFLRRNRADIEPHMCLMLRDDLAAGKHGIAMNRLYDYRAWHLARRAEVAATRKAIAAVSQDSILVSEENLMGLMPGHLGAGFYPGFERFCAALGRLAGVAEIHPRLIVRRQDRLLESIYGFRVAFGLRDDMPAFLAPLVGEDLSWMRMIHAFERFGFGETAKIDVLEAWPREGTTAHLMAFLGLPELPLSGGGLRMGNSRFSEAALELMLAMNRTGTGVDISWRRQVLFPALRQGAEPTVQLIAELLELPEDRAAVLRAALQVPARFSLTDEERAAILKSCGESNCVFLKHAMVGASGDIWA